MPGWMPGLAQGVMVGAMLGLLPAPDDRLAPALRPGHASAAGGTALPLRGRELLAQYQCSACHAIPGVPGTDSASGPPLQRFGRRSYIAGTWPNDAAHLARWIADPQALRPGTPMPALVASARDAQAMAAYLLTLE